MNSLKVAVVGTGYFSQFHYDAWSRLPVKLVGCCSLDKEAARGVAQQFGIPQVFAEFGEMLDTTKGGSEFDTSLPNNLNTGHEYGTGVEEPDGDGLDPLTDEQRKQLVEYMKSL